MSAGSKGTFSIAMGRPGRAGAAGQAGGSQHWLRLLPAGGSYGPSCPLRTEQGRRGHGEAVGLQREQTGYRLVGGLRVTTTLRGLRPVCCGCNFPRCTSAVPGCRGEVRCGWGVLLPGEGGLQH